MHLFLSWLTAMAAVVLAALPGTVSAQIAEPVRVQGGLLSGVAGSDSSVRVFKGVPFAAPPVGDLRWKAPQPVKSWKGVRKADHFGARPMQLPLYGDMIWRSEGISEDCLSLNVWTPAKSNKERLPVLVYFYGGGFVAGDSSEPRYDGESMARRGIVAITVNYRLGIFGFFAHPELTQESPHHAAGNYGLLDQSAALEWVRRNVAAFGGDPKHITIAGESAGSFSVSAQMASPLSKNLIVGAIGESGAMLGPTLAAQPREQVEKNGVAFATEVGAASLAALRAMPAQQILDATKSDPFRFSLTIDGYFLPKSPLEIYTAGEQAHVPLLAGWNTAESGAGAVLGKEPATVEGFTRAMRTLYGARAADALKAYSASTDAEAKAAATALASDRFIGYGTWKWVDLHGKTGDKPVYRYLYSHPRPGEGGASHSAEIEYALGNLALNPHYIFTDNDRKVSATMQAYFVNFIKTGDPNASELPEWPAVNRGSTAGVMHLDITSGAEPAQDRAHYLFLEQVYTTGR
ncbi:MAG: carboxylesterase [Chthonomonadaceae bacterium]|nr:carboxylesterase [Chthonomonadaceae bacterium]